MAKMNWTKQQHNAIHARGGSILVSAAAGSGKTAVLAQRVTELLTDKTAPVPADRLLVATFSNAAAAEMRERIAAKLADLTQQHPENTALLKQQILLESASIGTVHSFCLNLVRSAFQSLDLPPDFRIADERELLLWREDALNTVIEEGYASGDAGFLRLSQTLSTGRDDKRLAQGLDRLYDFMRARPFYDAWLGDILHLYDTRDIGKSIWGAQLFEYAEESLAYVQMLLEEAISIASEDERMAGAYMGALLSDFSLLKTLREQIERRDWDGSVEALSAFSFARLGALRGYENERLKASVTERRDAVKKIIAELATRRFCATQDESAQDIAALSQLSETLFSLALRLDTEYEQRKRARGAVDFSDLEQMALHLLAVRHPDGRIERTALAQALSERYEHILIDEYQDTNEVQELIFSLISRGEANLFMVGDVKQSIYRFRQAMPEIFMEKKSRFAPFGSGVYPASIVLGNNFRSRSEVTEFVNFTFAALMSKKLGEVDYNAQEALIPSADYPESALAGVEMHLIEPPDGTVADEKTALEAEYAAALIQQLLREGAPVFAGGVSRPIRAGDVCILLRSPSKRAPEYERALLARGIGAKASSKDGLLSTREVRMALALLYSVDNPLLDVELAACMLSPLFGFTPAQLSRVRLHDQTKSLYACVILAAEQGGAACIAFLQALGQLRALAAILPADRFIRRAYELTGCMELAGAWENGAQRQANLRLLTEYAGGFESGAGHALSGFLAYIERLRRRGDELPCAFSGEGADAVRILSIHASKGLEFPVVLLCDTARRFNKEELRANMLIDQNLGFACMLRDTELLNQYTTAPLEAGRIRAEREMLSEELRILYVALTRARERLILTGLIPDVQRKLCSLAQRAGTGAKVPAFAAQEAGCLADWLLLALLRHPDAAPLRELAGADAAPCTESASRVRVVVSPPVPEGEGGGEQRQRTAQPDPALTARIRRNMRWVYPHQKDTLLPTKLSVTQITHPQTEELLFSARPAFLSGQGMTAAQRGTAAHLFLRWADFTAAAADTKAELARLAEAGYLTPEQAGAVDLRAMERFFCSPLAKRIQNGQNIRREWSFLTELGARELAEYLPEIAGDERITVQGVADLVFEEQGRLMIIDYKTDRISSMQELAERYGAQLALYRVILQEQLGLPVGAAILYSLYLHQEIEL